MGEIDVFLSQIHKLRHEIVDDIATGIRLGKGDLQRFQENIDQVPLLFREGHLDLFGIGVIIFDKCGFR